MYGVPAVERTMALLWASPMICYPSDVRECWVADEQQNRALGALIFGPISIGNQKVVCLQPAVRKLVQEQYLSKEAAQLKAHREALDVLLAYCDPHRNCTWHGWQAETQDLFHYHLQLLPAVMMAAHEDQQLKNLLCDLVYIEERLRPGGQAASLLEDYKVQIRCVLPANFTLQVAAGTRQIGMRCDSPVFAFCKWLVAHLAVLDGPNCAEYVVPLALGMLLPFALSFL